MFLVSCELFISLESTAKMKIETTEDFINMIEWMHYVLNEFIFDTLLRDVKACLSGHSS